MLNLELFLNSFTNLNTVSVHVKPELPAIIFQLVASIGLFLIIRKYAWPGFKQSILERGKYINKTLDEAEKIKAESVAAKDKYEIEVNEIKNAKKEIFASTTKEANLQKEQIINESKQRGREIIEKSKQEAELSIEMIENQIQKEMMMYVNEVSSKFISEKISDEEELKMIEEAIAGLK